MSRTCNDDLISRSEATTEFQLNAKRYSLAKESNGTGEIVWSDYLISLKDALDILRSLSPIGGTDER